MKIHKFTCIVFTFISLSFFTACQKDQKQQNKTELAQTNQNDSLLQVKLNYPKNEIALNENAQNETEKWMIYTAMEAEVTRMENYTLDDVINNAPSILRATDTLVQTIPKQFRIKPVESRIKVLHTKASVLNQLCNKQQKGLDEVKKVAEEIPIDFYNLNIQLNEVFIEMPEIENLEK